MKEVCDSYALACDSPDGVIGFSQGTAMFMAIQMYRELGKFDHPILRSIKLFISFNTDPSFLHISKLQWQRATIPSLHVLSEQDFLFHKGVWAPSLFKESEMIIHNYGHRFPILDTLQKQTLKDFIKRNASGDQRKELVRHQSRL